MQNSINTLRSIEDIFKRYEELGFFIVPVAHKGKAPLLDPAKYATNSAKQMLEWFNSKKYTGCNWGLLPSKSGLVVIDVDKRQGGLELWSELSRGEDVRTMTQRSASGGLHFLFKARTDVKYKKPLTKQGIDTQWKNIIVVFPSMLAEGNQYTWIDESPIQELPQKFHDLFAATHGQEQAPVNFIGIENYIQKIAGQLKNKKLGYDEWVQVGMAIHSSLPTPEGLRLWKEISSGVNFKEGDLEQCEYKWSGFSSKGGLTARSLAFIARELGCEIPSLTLEEDKALFATEQQRIEIEAEQNPGWFTDEKGRIVCVHKEFVIDDLNRQGFFIEQEANPGKIGKLMIANDGYRTVNFMKTTDFALQTGKQFLKTYKHVRGEGWRAEFTKINKLWIENARRQEYSRVIFNHKDEPGALNLWSPLPCNPIAGDVSLFLQLIFDGVAAGNLDKGLWLLDWLAHIVQRPQERCSLVPVLIGDQGTGKGFLFDRIMKVILGNFHNTINRSSILKERFNYEQACKFLTFIDEASWRGDKEEDGILKNLTGSKQMTVEQKFGGRFAVNNYSRYAIASNNPEAVSIERSNRRYVVFEVNKAFATKHAFFKALADQLEKGTLAQHVLDHLLKRDISRFEAHKLPLFDDGQGHQAKIASEGVEAEFWNDLFNHTPRELWKDEHTLLKDVAFSQFLLYANRTKTYRKGLSQESFWRKTYAFLKIDNTGRTRILLAGKRREAVLVGPKEAATRFSETLHLSAPRDFDASAYIFTDESALVAVFDSLY
jgi:hypothetical protein